MMNARMADQVWSQIKMRRATAAYKAAMQPHNAALRAISAQQAALLVIFVSAAFAAGQTSREDVNSSIRKASEMSGIPVDAWQAMSDFQICLAQLRQTKPSVITGGKK
jgi:hypothetical protein